MSPAGPPGRIVEWLRNGSVQAVVDDRIMAEYAEVLQRPQFGLPVAEVNLMLLADLRDGVALQQMLAQDFDFFLRRIVPATIRVFVVHALFLLAEK